MGEQASGRGVVAAVWVTRSLVCQEGNLKLPRYAWIELIIAGGVLVFLAAYWYASASMCIR
jgi:hypothetical protein